MIKNKKKSLIYRKLKFIVKILKMQKLLRQERESIIEIKKINGNKLPPGILLEGKDALVAFKQAEI